LVEEEVVAVAVSMETALLEEVNQAMITMEVMIHLPFLQEEALDLKEEEEDLHLEEEIPEEDQLQEEAHLNAGDPHQAEVDQPQEEIPEEDQEDHPEEEEDPHQEEEVAWEDVEAECPKVIKRALEYWIFMDLKFSKPMDSNSSVSTTSMKDFNKFLLISL